MKGGGRLFLPNRNLFEVSPLLTLLTFLNKQYIHMIKKSKSVTPHSETSLLTPPPVLQLPLTGGHGGAVCFQGQLLHRQAHSSMFWSLPQTNSSTLQPALYWALLKAIP